MDIDGRSEKINDYLLNEMSEQERAAFEEEMAADRLLAEKVKQQEEMFNKLRAMLNHKDILDDPGYAKAMKDAEELVEKEVHGKSIQKKKNIKRYLNIAIPLLAASIAIFIISHIVISIGDPLNIYQKYYKPFAFNNATGLDSLVASEILNQTRIQLQNDNYDTAIDELKTIIKQGELTTWGSFLLGATAAFKDQYDNAEEVLIYSIEEIPTFNKYDTEWYLALTYIKLNQMARAESLLQNLQKEDPKRGRKAKRMLTRIK